LSLNSEKPSNVRYLDNFIYIGTIFIDMEPNREEKAIILDFLQNGYMDDKRPSHMKDPIAQGIGITNFSLLELVTRKDVFLQPYEEVYIGEGKRDKIHHISGRLKFEKLTTSAQAELEFVVKELIKKNEQQFVDFFNNSQPLSTRMHQLELLPGLGKKHMWEIIDERKGNPFKDFEDIKARVKLLANPEKLVAARIMLELKGDQKHNVFVKG